MKIAILESIIMPAGHEVEFDRILVNELRYEGHEPLFFVPPNFPFKVDYGTPIEHLRGGEVVTYAGAGKLKKLWLSLLREKRRRAWFDSAYDYAMAGKCDAIIIPTVTYRYVKALLDSKLKDSPVPIYMIFHGINPKEQPKFVKAAKSCEAYKHIHLKVLAMYKSEELSSLPNVSYIVPPVYKPVTKIVEEMEPLRSPLQLGFFGQFRKEKQLHIILDAFVTARFSCPVQLLVQGATTTQEDADAFNALIEEYKGHEHMKFLHKSLIGQEWEDALLSVDALVMPYGAERYRYHPSAMLFTAIGFYKPMLLSEEINPEVLNEFAIGKRCEDLTVEGVGKGLEELVESLMQDKENYALELRKANEKFSHRAMVASLLQGAHKE